MRSTTKWSLDRAIKATQALLALTLMASAILATWVVATDGWLRAVAPTHQYGLLAFAIFDLLLSLIVFLAPRVAALGAFTAAMFQVAAMLGDAFTFSPAGTMQAAFRAYLLGDMAFLALLGIQLAVAGMTAMALAMHLVNRHGVHFGQGEPLKSLH